MEARAPADLSERDRAALQRRTLRMLIGAQILGGAGFFLGFAVAILLARELTDSDVLVGVPIAVAVAVGALAAPPMGAWMQRSGRRPALVAGQLVAAAGAVVVVLAARAESFPLLCVGMAIFGVTNTTNLLARYAGGDLAAPERRGQAISAVLLATAVGAILGPNLAEAAGGLGDELGVIEEAAPFAISALLLVAAAAVLWTTLRPDPLLVAERLAGGAGPDGGGRAAPRLAIRDWPRMALIGAAAIVLSHTVMVAIMTVTPLHLDDAGQSLGTVGLVISLHVAGMFLPSPITGRLVDRVGRLQVIAAAGVVFILAAGIAATTTGHHSLPVIVALVLLGIGWNLGIIGGSTLLTDVIPIDDRARAQGQADFAMGMAGALGSLAAAPLIEAGSFAALGILAAWIGAGITLIAIRAGALARRAQVETA